MTRLSRTAKLAQHAAQIQWLKRRFTGGRLSRVKFSLQAKQMNLKPRTAHHPTMRHGSDAGDVAAAARYQSTLRVRIMIAASTRNSRPAPSTSALSSLINRPYSAA
jgi:hypothetical protein